MSKFPSTPLSPILHWTCDDVGSMFMNTVHCAVVELKLPAVMNALWNKPKPGSGLMSSVEEAKLNKGMLSTE